MIIIWDIKDTLKVRLLQINNLVIICIAITVYLLCSFLHEGLSHGVTAWILGVHGFRVSTSELIFNEKLVSRTNLRIINIAGPIGSLIYGFILAMYHKYGKIKGSEFRFFIWLAAYVCLFQGGGYFMALSFVNFGDINGFVTGLKLEFLFRLIFTIIGILISFIALYFASKSLDEFLGCDNTKRRKRAAKLIVPSYISGSLAITLSVLLSPNSSYMAFFSAIPATFGGTIFLLYVILGVGKSNLITKVNPYTPSKNNFCYLIGFISVLIYIFILGPGILL